MPPKITKKSSHGQDQWWDALRLIAGLDATATQKYLLTLVFRHTNKTKGYAWASQETLAWEMCTDTRTVQRAFQWATETGIVCVQRIRKAKRPSEQHNHYSLDVERMKLLQRQREHPTPTSGDKAHEHTTPVSDDSAEHTTNRAPNTRHFKHGTHDTSVVEGFEVSGNEDSGDEKARAAYAARKTAAPQSGLATRPELRARAPENNSARNWVRNPAHGAGNKIIQALATAGERGVSSVELAAHLYGDSENRARDRVVQIVAGLRKKGFSILLTGSDPFARRYVLRKN